MRYVSHTPDVPVHEIGHHQRPVRRNRHVNWTDQTRDERLGLWKRVRFDGLRGGRHLTVEARVQTVDKTGVEMEAMTAAAVAALTVYDMVKAVERGVTITRVELVEKSGGKSGTWRRGR